jgi:hypothetical protein
VENQAALLKNLNQMLLVTNTLMVVSIFLEKIDQNLLLFLGKVGAIKL